MLLWHYISVDMVLHQCFYEIALVLILKNDVASVLIIALLLLFMTSHQCS